MDYSQIVAFCAVLFVAVGLFLCFFLEVRSNNFHPAYAGVTLGVVYFILMPILALIFMGRHEVIDAMTVGDWKFFDFDEKVESIVKVCVLGFVFFLFLMFRNIVGTKLLLGKATCNNEGVGEKNAVVLVYLAMYFLLSLVFNLPGYLAGSEWHERLLIAQLVYGAAIASLLKLLLISFLLMAGYSVLELAVKMRSKLQLLLFLSLPVFEMYISGNRVYVLLFLIAYFIFLLIEGRFRTILVFAVLCFPLAGISNLWAIIRGSVHEEGIIVAYNNYQERLAGSDAVHEVNGLAEFVLSVSEGANVMVLLDLVEKFSGEVQYRYFDSLLKLTAFWVPRSIYEDKPLSFPQFTAGLYEPQFEGFSLNATLLGEAWSVLGAAGVPVFMFFYFLVVTAFCNIWRRFCFGSKLWWFIPFTVSFLTVRAGSFSDIFVLLILLLITQIACRFLGWVRLKSVNMRT